MSTSVCVTEVRLTVSKDVRHIAPMNKAASRRISRAKRREANAATTEQPPTSWVLTCVSDACGRTNGARGSAHCELFEGSPIRSDDLPGEQSWSVDLA